MFTLGDVLASKTPEPDAPVCWAGDVPKEDLMGHPLTTVFYDARIGRTGPWAILSHASFLTSECKLGLGFGQKYHKQADGRWLKVKG